MAHRGPSSRVARARAIRAAHGGLTRRQFIRGMGAVGAMLPAGAYLAACGTGDDGESQTVDADTEAPEAPAANGNGAIVATYMAADTYDSAALDLRPDFTAGTGIDVEIVAQPWAVLNQTHVTDLTTRTGEFDVISGEWWIASVFQHMLPIDDLVAQAGIGDAYIPRIFEPGPSGFFEGQRIGVPYSADAYGILYRTDLFEEAGVSPDWETWEDLYAICEELRGTLPSGASPLVFAHGSPDQLPSLFQSAYGGYLVDENDTYNVDHAEAADAIEMVRRGLDYAPSNAAALSIDEANSVFIQGDAAILVCWPSFVRAAADDESQSSVVGSWRLAHMPGPGFTNLSCWNHYISRYSEDPDAAWEWIRAYANPENGTPWMAEYGIGSPFQETYEDEAALAEHGHDYPYQAENLGRTKAPPWLFEANDICGRVLGEVVTGVLEPDEAVDAMVEQWGAITVPEALVEQAEAEDLKA